MFVTFFRSIISLMLVLTFASIQIANGQSTHDLEPPTQVSPTIVGSIEGVSPPNRFFHFAAAELDGEGNVVLITKRPEQVLPPTTFKFKAKPKLKPGQKLKTITEHVNKTLPRLRSETAFVGGKQIIRKVQYWETGSVPVTRQVVVDEDGNKVDAAEIELEEMEQRTETYVVQEPFEKVLEDGSTAILTKSVARTRTISVPKGYKPLDESAIRTTRTFKADSIKCYDANGEEISAAKVKDQLVERKPVILISDPSSISPFFAHVLIPGTMFVVAPSTGEIALDSNKVDAKE